jgi:large subunit ribosomal protein L25
LPGEGPPLKLADGSVIDAVSFVDAPASEAPHRTTRHFEESTAVAEVRLLAEPRTEFGKGGARRTRRAGKVPAVIYGHGADPRHVALPARELANAIRHGGSNVLLTLEVEGDEQLAIPKAIQRHPIKGHFEHVDLLAVRRGEKVTIDVPVHVVGELAPGGLLNQEGQTISVEAEATHLPTGIEIDITGLAIGSQVTAGSVKLPEGSTLIVDPSTILVIIAEAPTEAEIEAEMAEAADELGIVEDAPDEPAEGGSADGEGEAAAASSGDSAE